MTDLDIGTAMLIIQLARDDIYGLGGNDSGSGGSGGGDEGDGSLTDLEFALAEQEREFMEYWTDYGDARVAPLARVASGSAGASGLGQGASGTVASGSGLPTSLAASSSSSSSSRASTSTPVSGTLTTPYIPVRDEDDEDEVFGGHHSHDGIGFYRALSRPVRVGCLSDSSTPYPSSPTERSVVFPILEELLSPASSSPPLQFPTNDSQSEDNYAAIYDHEPELSVVVPVEPSVECFFCKDLCPSSSTFSTVCDHHVCRSCITRNIEICMRDETAYPPKCCDQKIPLIEIVNIIQDASLKEKYKAKCTEYETPIRNRVYCFKCADFLGSKVANSTGPSSSLSSSLSLSHPPVLFPTIRSIMYCTECSTATCTSCKQNSHLGQPCQETPSEAALKRLAIERGWQTCPDCQAIVELFYGCYHIKCRCTTEFCYLCAKKWKGCNCDNFDEDRLVALGAQVQ
ncbi:hypothetical protein AX15_004370 [Amanita polypyramis BW_CC]|nr:hypothetical protein AX15_004370 [Amanita polypyramis BW_CC]